jgi:hypothetical protein
MSLNIVDIPEVEQRPGDYFDRAVRERLVNAHPLKLPIYSTQELKTLTAKLFAGYLVGCSNGDAGDECLAYCDGFNWKVVALGDNISLS